MRLINSACPFRQFCAAAGDTVVEFRKEYIEEMMILVFTRRLVSYNSSGSLMFLSAAYLYLH